MKKILIIEDDPIAGHIYRTRLEKEGFKVELATDGQIGFARLMKFRPDGLLLDLMLPKTSGCDLLRQIRELDSFQNLPVIAFTNAFVPQMIAEAYEAGATRVFDKSTLTPCTLADAFRGCLTGPAAAA